MREGIGSAATGNDLSIPTNAANGIGLGSTVTLGLPTDSATSNAVPLTSNSVVYGNTSASTDTVVKTINAQTVETYDVIRSKNAPDQFVYQLNNLPSGVLLKQVDAQTVETYLPQQTYGTTAAPETVVATIKALWAKDANGVSIPAFLTIGANNTVILHILHKNGNYLYPIVADPFAWWGWHGFMWWGDDWTTNHYLGGALAGIGLASLIGQEEVAAVATIISGVAYWCEGRNGATFYFNFVPWYPFVTFAGCSKW